MLYPPMISPLRTSTNRRPLVLYLQSAEDFNSEGRLTYKRNEIPAILCTQHKVSPRQRPLSEPLSHNGKWSSQASKETLYDTYVKYPAPHYAAVSDMYNNNNTYYYYYYYYCCCYYHHHHSFKPSPNQHSGFFLNKFELPYGKCTDIHFFS